MIAIGFSGVVGAQQASPSPVTAFEHVAVIPMDRARLLRDQTVVVQGNRIVALGSAARVRVPTSATHVDGRGKFLIPGLADMHAHVPGLPLIVQYAERIRQAGGALDAKEGNAEAERMLLLYAANGVTTVRVMGYTGPGILDLRERAATGQLFSPRIYAAAGPVDGVPLNSIGRFVAKAKAVGYDFLKLHGVGGAVFDSAVTAARRVGLPLAGHMPEEGAQGLARALQAGYTSIEHLYGLPAYLADSQHLAGESLNGWPVGLRADAARLRMAARTLRRAHVWSTPTEILFERYRWSLDTLARWPEMRYVADSTLQLWRSGDFAGLQEMTRSDPSAAPDSVIAARRLIIRALKDAGAGLLLGTDVGVPFLIPGFAVHRELQALVAAGLTPYEALLTGTRNVATYLGTQDSTGTIAVGKRADLVLLTGNPLDEVRYTQAIAGVMLAGRWLPRAELDRRLLPLEHSLFPLANR